MGQIVPDKRFNIPMALTWARIAFIPLIVGVFFVPDVILSPHVKNLLACVMFVVAAITDALDGYIARRYNMMTNMGAFLDSVADKLVVCSAIVVLLAFDRVDMLVALIIVGREIAVTALREWMAKIGAAASVKVRKDQNHCADDRHPDASLFRSGFRFADCMDRHCPHLHCGDSDYLFDVRLHVRRLATFAAAGSATQLKSPKIGNRDVLARQSHQFCGFSSVPDDTFVMTGLAHGPLMVYSTLKR